MPITVQLEMDRACGLLGNRVVTDDCALCSQLHHIRRIVIL